MSDDTLKALEKAVKKHKRLASEAAMELHDLVEDRLPAAFGELPEIAERTYQACQAWDEARKALESAQAS